MKRVFNRQVKNGILKVGETTNFSIGEYSGQDKYDLTIIYGITGNVAPTLGSVVVLRNDVNKVGNIVKSVVGYDTFNKLNFAVAILAEQNVSLSVTNLTPNNFDFRNSLDVEIQYTIIIDVLTQLTREV